MIKPLATILVMCSTLLGTAWAGPALTYHGRILKSDGTPVSGNTQFKIQIRSPGTENCLLYELTVTKDLTASSGFFAIGINDGVGTRTDSSGYSFDKIFSNRANFNLPAGSCAAGGTTYAPASGDGRSLLVYFNDGTFSGWETVPQQAVNLVPQAIDAMQVGGFSPSSLLRVADAGGPQTAPVLTPANMTELIAIITGTSTNYMKTAGGTQSPVLTNTPSTPAAGQVWYDQTDNVFKYYNGTTTTVIGSSGSSTTLAVNKGGTGATSFTANQLILGNGTSALSPLASGTTGQILRSAGSSAPAWTTATFPSAVTSQALLFGSATNVVGEVTVPSVPSVLVSTAVTGAPQWSGGSANTFLRGSSSGVSFGAVDISSADVTGVLPVSRGGTGASSLEGSFVLNGGQAGAVELGTTDSTALTFNTNALPRMKIASTGEIGIGTTSPSSTLSFAGNSASKIAPERNSTANTAGSNLTISAGGATLGATDKAGGNLILSAGTSTGTAAASIQFQTSPVQGSTSTTDNTLASVMTIIGNSVGIGMVPAANSSIALDVNGNNRAVRFLAGSGTVGNPSYGISGGTSNGLYFPATNSLGLVTNGAARLSIDANGNVGIATAASSAAKLEVAGTIKATAFDGPFTAVNSGAGSNTAPSLTFSGDPNTGFYNANSDDKISTTVGGTKIFEFNSTGLVSDTTGGASVGTASGTAAAPTFSFAGDTDTGWYRPAADTLAATTAGVERMRVDSAGKVGFGMTPSYDVDVFGSMRLGVGLGINTPPSTSTLLKVNAGANGSPAALIGHRQNADDIQPLLSLQRTRSDAAAPAAGLGGSIEMALQGFGGAAAIPTAGKMVWGWEGAQTNTTTDRDSYIAFSTAADGTLNERMRIDSAGRVSIGVSSPNSMLNVSSSSNVTTGTIFGTSFGLSINNSAASSASYRSMNMSVGTNTTQDNSGDITAGWFEVRPSNTGSITGSSIGVTSTGMIQGGSAPTLNVNKVIGVKSISLSSFSNTASGTVSNAYSFYAENAQKTNQTVTNQAIIGIADASTATNNTNLLIGNITSIPTGNFSIYNRSTNPNYFEGKLGIGAVPVTEKLEVTGNIAATGQIAGGSRTIASATTAVDWNYGNAISTDYNCASPLVFSNLRDGGTYTLVVTGTATTQCNFSTAVDGTGAATVSYRFRPANSARTASSHTVYTLMRVGTIVYVSWATGF